MSDLEYGLGALWSPPDERDWPVAALYLAAGIDRADALPATYTIPAPFPPVLNQGSTPMCVAYASATVKGYEDLRDQGPGQFNFDKPLFFSQIGGTATGATARNGLQRLKDFGYPLVGNAAAAAQHKIAAYYAVPVTQMDIQQAILAFGPVLVSTYWYNAWFHPVNGVLPAPGTIVGGHLINAIGWDSVGLRLRNSWGTSWSQGGDVTLPWAYLSRVKEVWKAVDVIELPPPPKPKVYTLRIAPGVVVQSPNLGANGCIASWTTKVWGSRASTAPCLAPVVKRGCVRGSATVAYVTAGAFKGRFVRVIAGVTVTSS